MKTIVLGDENDEVLATILVDVLRERGAEWTPMTWAMGGSQLVGSTTVVVRGLAIVVESETYIGLSIQGQAVLVDELASAVAERQKVNRR